MLGGTEFVGRAIAEEALARGGQVTEFHRGRHDPPPEATALRGERGVADGLAALARGEWDVVVDTWSGAPSAVRGTARLLAGRAGSYVYISSRSVYAYPAPAGLGEDGPLVEASGRAQGVPHVGRPDRCSINGSLMICGGKTLPRGRPAAVTAVFLPVLVLRIRRAGRPDS